jgi:carbamoyltransferase
MSYILGINSAYHESSACLIKNGVIIAFAEEERFNRIKHGKSAKVDNPHHLPLTAIAFCLSKAGITLNQVDQIGYSFEPDRRLKHIGVAEPVVEGDWGSEQGEQVFDQHLKEVPARLSQALGSEIEPKFHWLSHHLCHASSAYFVSPFPEAAVLSIDGIGEFATTYLGYGQGNQLKAIQELQYPNSLGFLWEKLSKFLGFDEYDACKVMGLASYGNPDRYYESFRRFIQIQNYGSFTIDNDVLRFRVEDYSQLEATFGVKQRDRNEQLQPEHSDIAATLQKITEEVVLELANYLHHETNSQYLCIAGGVGLNCVANTVIQARSPFQEIYIQPAANDAGTAIGAAFYLWNQALNQPRSYVMDNPYLGPEYTDNQIQQVLESHQLAYSHHPEIETITAKLLAEGHIVAWFQGRMEAGPRALGNRSLLADPRNPNVREILNLKVKHRENFRPFAPSILAEKVDEWFEVAGKSISSDWMLFAYRAQSAKSEQIPAVLHVDGTSRVQTVKQTTNPKYHKLISEFEQLTHVPILLNTSFNDREPIVCSPEDAVNTFLKTKIDYLVIGNYLVARHEN